MPELPDIVVYLEALEQRLLNQTLERVQLATPFQLRTAVPPLSSVEGRKVIALRRLGKRICFGLEGEQWLVLHLMIAGRLHWHPGPIKLSRSPKNRGLPAFQFSNGTLSLPRRDRNVALRCIWLKERRPAASHRLEIFQPDIYGPGVSVWASP